MKTRIIILSALTLLFTACTQEASIKVQNLVHNVSLQDINYGDYGLTYTLYPGETSDERFIYDDEENWPKAEQLEFYMLRDGNMVYLHTKQYYTLNAEDEMLIIISDTTEVISPFGKKSTLADLTK